MIEMFVAGVIGFAVLLVVGLVAMVLAAVFGLLILPFKLLGWLLRGLGLLIFLPFLVLGGIVLMLVVGGGALLPLLPLAVIAWGLWRIFTGGRRSATV